MGALKLLSLIQRHQDVDGLFALSSWVGGHLGPAITSYHSRTTRRELEREMPKIVRQGSLPHLLDLIDNAQTRQEDRDGYALAEVQYAAAATEIGEIQESDGSRADSAEAMGQQAAAMSSIVITMIIICVVILMDVW